MVDGVKKGSIEMDLKVTIETVYRLLRLSERESELLAILIKDPTYEDSDELLEITNLHIVRVDCLADLAEEAKRQVMRGNIYKWEAEDANGS